ncbi:uncharacterized protein B0H64DRAFT_406342 [Chaetomium fimeti]|uniref:Uncharacterized protein n=1 Tax=Chaetomium fimeti TaxID=1854472 RepID=A0AAE0H9M5_9PEZI|nr:hypothetical protein B0H64DRAFT_406342 [Chaetomium fimeti]
MRQIAQKSDGVFLWVTLTLKMIIDSLDGREPLKSIMAQVDSLPEELETLFGRVLESIPKVQRTSAYSYFAYALGLATIQAENWLEFWPFLDDYIESPNFAKGLPLEWIKPEKRPRRIGIAADRIQSRTRGLLEIAPGDMDDRIGSLVVFAHRSIPEFLQDALETEKIRRQIRDFDFIRAHINVLLAYAKSTQLSDIDFRHSLILREYQIVPLISFIRGMKETTASKYFYELNLLDEATTRQHSSRRSVSRSLVSSPTPDSPWVSFPSWRSPTPACVACSMGFNDYVVWKAATYPKTLQTSVGIGLFEAILDTVRLHRANASRRESVRGLKSLLREMMKLDIDLSQLPNRGGAVTDRLSYWAFILQLMCLDRESGRHWTHLETMLENGAPNPSWRRSGEMVNLHLGDEVYSYHWDVVERDWDPKLLPASKLDRGDTITLKDWVDEYEPENGGKILMLLGGTTTDDETTTAKAEDEKTGYLDRRLQTFFAAAWNRLSQLLGSRALPWILVGLFSALLLREGVGSWAR